MTILTTAQITRLTAAITGTEPKGAANKEAAATRFRKVLAEAIGEMNADARADNILGAASFGEAFDFLRIAIARRFEATASADAAEQAQKPASKERAPGKRATVLAAAQRGDLPPVPDFSAETHKRYRAKLAEVVAAAEAGDLAALRAFEINPTSSSPKAIAKYRELAILALEAQASAA